jgi:hypothetical protein
MKIDRSFYLLGLVFLLACSPVAPKTESSLALNIDQLIETQITHLAQHKNVLEKEADVDGTRSDSTFVPTPEIWKSELEIFRQLNLINKPVHKGAYRQEGPLNDTRSNLKIMQYVSTTSPLVLLKIYYQNDPAIFKKIEGILRESNQLYTNNRSLSLEFDEDNGTPMLITYSVVGFQKVAVRDTVKFYVRGHINW